VRLDVAEAMLPVSNYTMQAARVLAYVGTRGCYRSLIDTLSDPNFGAPGEIIAVLREETGAGFGFDSRGPRARNQEAIIAWQRWWDENRASFPESLDEGPPQDTAVRGAPAGARGAPATP